MKTDGGPAFPTQDYDRGAAHAGFAVTVTDNPGMSLRDWFAAYALAWAGNSAWLNQDPHYMADRAYKMADAMLEARSAQ